MRRWHLLVGVLVLVIAVAAAVLFQQRRAQATGARAAGLLRAPEVRAPEGVRIRVQVLNATKTRGLARRATMLLRDRGFDVVETLPRTPTEKVEKSLLRERGVTPTTWDSGDRA